MDDTGAIPTRRRLGRWLAIAVLVLGAPAAMAGAATHLMLDGTSWTSKKTAPSVRPTSAPTAAPAPSRPAAVGPSGPIGQCAIATQTGALITPCTTPGARRVIATVRQDAAKTHPCATTALTDLVRRHGAYWLCLGTS